MFTDKLNEPADAGCASVTRRRFTGPDATEVFVHCHPGPSAGSGALEQARVLHELLREAILKEGGSLDQVVQETVFFRDIQNDLGDFLRARKQVFHDLMPLHAYQPASTFIQQPPVDPGARLEILASAVIPAAGKASWNWSIRESRPCACAACEQMEANVVLLGKQRSIFSGSIYGSSGSAFSEAWDMFRTADGMLRKAGMNFQSVVRTWIYLRNIDRDYADLNRARRAFFHRAEIELFPASTGIEGSPIPRDHNFCMRFHAIYPPDPAEISPISASTLNEAPDYGSDFSRGMRVVEANKISLHLSGTASVDEAGRTVHPGDFEAQVRRMLVNVSALLARERAASADIASAITYLQRASDAPTLRRLLAEHGVEGFPHAVVEAPLCRPDLLCEMEAHAILPPANGT